MKYIDAEKLTKAIEDKGLDCSFALKMERLDILALIDSLRQEQQEVDLEEEILRFDTYLEESGLTFSLSAIAHHFYELGLNARKEE